MFVVLRMECFMTTRSTPFLMIPWAFIQQVVRRLTTRSREVSKPRVSGSNFSIALKFDRGVDKSAAEMSVIFQSDSVTARFVTHFNLWLRHDLWPHNASICDPARFVTKSASICDQRYTMILESKLCRGKLVFVFTLIMYTKWYNMIIYIWIMI